MIHDGWFWLIKTNKYFIPLVNYSNLKVLLKSKLILCHGSELRQNQGAALEKRKGSQFRGTANWKYVYWLNQIEFYELKLEETGGNCDIDDHEREAFIS